MATLITNVQDVCLELGLPVPNAVATSTDDQTRQIMALMNRVGDTLLTETNWQMMVAEARFDTEFYQYTGDVVEGVSQITNLSSVTGLTKDFQILGTGILQDTFITSVSGNTAFLNTPANATATGVTFTFGRVQYDMPSDFERIVNKTQYDRTNRWAIVGPKDPQEWQWLKNSYISTGPRIRYRIIGNKFTIWPLPSARHNLGFEYQSNAWVRANDGTPKTRFSNDSDTCLFPDRLMVLGTKLKYFEIKGFDTGQLYDAYSRELSKFKSAESGADTLSLSPQWADPLLTMNQVPDTGYGNVTT